MIRTEGPLTLDSIEPRLHRHPLMPTVFAFIFARGGSKGVPRKNIRPLGGKPLIAHAIATARASRHIQRVIVSTDDEEIAAVARAHGAEVPALRPAELASDTASEWLAWRHAVTELAGEPFDVFVSIPPPAPLRTAEDVDACIDAYLAGDCDLVISGHEAHANPYFNMFKCDADGVAQLIIPPSASNVVRRQDAPTVYTTATIAYVSSPAYIMQASAVFSGRVKAVIFPMERALDIDNQLDFDFAEFLLGRLRVEG